MIYSPYNKEQLKPFKIDFRLKTEIGNMSFCEESSSFYFSASQFLGMTSPKEKQDSLQAWRDRVGEEEADKISRESAMFGSSIHSVCENFITKPDDFAFPEGTIVPVKQIFRSLSGEIEDSLETVYASEVWLKSDLLNIYGKVDCIGIWKGELAVIDFKTSRNFKPVEWCEDYFIQCYVYALMVYEMTGQMPTKLVLPIFSKYDDSIIYEAHTPDYTKRFNERYESYRKRIRESIVVREKD